MGQSAGRRRSPLFAAVLLLAACDRGGDDTAAAPAEPPSPAARPADPPAAMPGVTLSQRDLDDYALYRSVARDLRAQGQLGLAGLALPEGFDVRQCDSLAIDDAERLPPRAAALQQAAAVFAELEHDLGEAGYDPAIYAPALAALERARLRLIGDAAEPDPRFGDAWQALDEAFVAAVEPARRARQPDRPPIVAEGGCGAGETPQPFTIRPADGVARILRAFSFAVCARQRIDPWDTARCPGWLSARDGGSLPLSGTYRVQVRWPDGRRLRSDFTTQAFAEDDALAPIRLDAADEGNGA